MLQEKNPNTRFFHKSDRVSQLEEVAKGGHDDRRVRLEESGRLEEGDCLSETYGNWSDVVVGPTKNPLILKATSFPRLPGVENGPELPPKL